MFRDVPCSWFYWRPPKKRSGGGRQSPELDIRRIAKIFIQWNQNLYFITRIPRGVYIIFGGFFKNFIFPTSGRYLQTSALKRRTGKKEASFFDHLNCCSEKKTWKDCITNQSSFFTFNMQIVTFLFNSNFISLMLSSSQDFV